MATTRSSTQAIRESGASHWTDGAHALDVDTSGELVLTADLLAEAGIDPSARLVAPASGRVEDGWVSPFMW